MGVAVRPDRGRRRRRRRPTGPRGRPAPAVGAGGRLPRRLLRRRRPRRPRPRAHRAGLAVDRLGLPLPPRPGRRRPLERRGPGLAGPGRGWPSTASAPTSSWPPRGSSLTERRARVYLGRVREAAGDRLLVATVYRPTDRLWTGAYPYTAIADYVDAFAPMVYWGCTEPGAATAEAVDRLVPAPPRPRHRPGLRRRHRRRPPRFALGRGDGTVPRRGRTRTAPSAPRSGCGSRSTTNNGRPCPRTPGTPRRS